METMIEAVEDFFDEYAKGFNSSLRDGKVDVSQQACPNVVGATNKESSILFVSFQKLR